MKELYIISGPNGAGKTTASYTILPEILHVNEFVNADEIAKGLSPLNPESVGIKAGRLMLERIDELMNAGKSFAFETTLATKSYKNLVAKAKETGYKTTLLFLYLESIDIAKERVRNRVIEGGHNIPEKVIERRYEMGLKNFFKIYKDVVEDWLLFDNTDNNPTLLALKKKNEFNVMNRKKWNFIHSNYGK
ncbi:MAG: zeta toxin family protein [Bacteroidia bacterium]